MHIAEKQCAFCVKKSFFRLQKMSIISGEIAPRSYDQA